MRIIMIRGSVETLEYFSLQLAETFKKRGHEVFLWDMLRPADMRSEIVNLMQDEKETVLITFNFIGLCGESQFQDGDLSIWERCNMRILCIMVDHPLYYYRRLHSNIRNLSLLCIDRNHVSYIKKYYPRYPVDFMPLAGNLWLEGDEVLPPIPLQMRDIDLVFAGNFVALSRLSVHTEHLTQEYRDFYARTIKRFQEQPDLELIEGMDQAIRAEMEDVHTEEEFLQAHFAMIYIDLYVRSWFRARTVTALADAGHKVFCVGKDWELAECKHPENISCTGELLSQDCMHYMERSKISLNVMPWFKDGAHDRIFTGMLMGCGVVSDGSDYLDEILCDGEDYLKFDLKDSTSVVTCVERLKKNPELLESLAEHGREKARKLHTWEQNADLILHFLGK